MTARLPPDATKQLDMPEGTLKIAYTLPMALTRVGPDQRMTLLAGESPAKTQVRFDVDEQQNLHFVREVPGGTCADVAVDLTPLIGAKHLDFWGTWSPTAMQIHVVDRDTDRIVSSEQT